MSAPKIIQIVLGSDNLPLAKHLYTTVFGFAGSGERVVYSERLGKAMGLGSIGGATALYMVGRQELMQLEFWHLFTPQQQPLPAEWRPSDIGFGRMGIAVTDFAGVLKRLDALNLPLMTPPVEVNGLRRACFQDPSVGIPVEIMEEGEGLPGRRDRYHDLDPAVVYVSASVTDLGQALAYFVDVVGLEKAGFELHGSVDEALWGLPDARRKTALLGGEGPYLELVEYESPVGRPEPRENGLSYQGLKTIGVGYRDPAETGMLFQRVKDSGLSWTVPEPASHISGNHVVEAVAHHMKTLSVPHEVERQFGYSPEEPKWWNPPPGRVSD